MGTKELLQCHHYPPENWRNAANGSQPILFRALVFPTSQMSWDFFPKRWQSIVPVSGRQFGKNLVSFVNQVSFLFSAVHHSASLLERSYSFRCLPGSGWKTLTSWCRQTTKSTLITGMVKTLTDQLSFAILLEEILHHLAREKENKAPSKTGIVIISIGDFLISLINIPFQLDQQYRSAGLVSLLSYIMV